MAEIATVSKISTIVEYKSYISQRSNSITTKASGKIELLLKNVPDGIGVAYSSAEKVSGILFVESVQTQTASDLGNRYTANASWCGEFDNSLYDNVEYTLVLNISEIILGSEFNSSAEFNVAIIVNGVSIKELHDSLISLEKSTKTIPESINQINLGTFSKGQKLKLEYQVSAFTDGIERGESSVSRFSVVGTVSSAPTVSMVIRTPSACDQRW
jgi:hypothetical protein